MNNNNNTLKKYYNLMDFKRIIETKVDAHK
jgi:hypothetical protein